MSSANALALARRRSTARLLELACLDSGWVVEGSFFTAPPSWLGLGQHRRDIYCSGERSFTSRLMDCLFAECPDARRAWYSAVWSCLDTGATEKHLADHLLTLAGPEWQSQPQEKLLAHLAAQTLELGPYDLPLVTKFVCAVRLARTSQHTELAGILAMKLARALFLLSVNWLYAPLSQEVWSYCGKTFIRGLRIGDAKVEFRDESWAFANTFIRETEAHITLRMLPKKTPRRLSAGALTETVVDVLTGLTSTSYTDTEFVLSRIPALRNFGRSEPWQVPSLEMVGVLRPR